MLRSMSVSCSVRARVRARNFCTARVEFPAFDISPWKAVESRASATTAVVPPPIGRAAVGVYCRSPVSWRLSLRAITLWAPAEVATSTTDGSIAPSTGHAKSVDGFTWRTVCTVFPAASVAVCRWLRVPETFLPRCAMDARSGSANGSATTFPSETAASSEVSHFLATSWFFPATVVSPDLTR